MAPGMLLRPVRSLASSTSKRRSRSVLGAHLEKGALGGLVHDDGLIEHGPSPAQHSIEEPPSRRASLSFMQYVCWAMREN
jgi:hypothetical protein